MSPARWQAIWSERGPLAWLLWPVSLIYAALVGLRRWLYHKRYLTVNRLPVPVVVVGNVVVGGAGKTPTVIALVHHLKNQGWHPGVVSRGYGRTSDGVLPVRNDTSANDSGDEPALIQRSTQVPVFVGSRRADAARALLQAHPEVDLLLCDDGLQHLALGRDLSIAVFDERGIGNGWHLPAGLLREPWPPGRHAAFAPDLVLRQCSGGSTGGGLPSPPQIPMYQAHRRLASYAINPQGARVTLDELRAQPLIAVAGIARPEVFFGMLRERGLALQRTIALADHAAPQDYTALIQETRGTLICTEKDAVKLFPLLGPDVQAWAVPLEMTAEAGFWTAFDDLLNQRTNRH